MTTVINTPGNNQDSSGVTGMVIGIIAILFLVGLFVVYVLPAMRGSNEPVKQQDDSGINVDVNLSGGNDAPAPAPEPEAE